jgi:hypothetical protein
MSTVRETPLILAVVPFVIAGRRGLEVLTWHHAGAMGWFGLASMVLAWL